MYKLLNKRCWILFFFGKSTVAYLWLNPIGCAACVGFSLIFQFFLPSNAAKESPA